MFLIVTIDKLSGRGQTGCLCSVHHMLYVHIVNTNLNVSVSPNKLTYPNKLSPDQFGLVGLRPI